MKETVGGTVINAAHEESEDGAGAIGFCVDTGINTDGACVCVCALDKHTSLNNHFIFYNIVPRLSSSTHPPLIESIPGRLSIIRSHRGRNRFDTGF